MKIFISYRRRDSQVVAGRMAQFLDAVPAVDEVFLDVDDIPLGEDFLQRIGRTLGQASHVLLLIGPQWAGGPSTSQPGRTRLFDADDVVREETRLALATPTARLVPVLIDDTPMPQPAELPAELQALSRRNAFVLRTAHFNPDMDDLLDALAGDRPARGSRWHLAPLTPVGIAARAAGGAVAGAAAMLLLGLAHRLLARECYDLACSLRQGLGLQSPDDAIALVWLLGLALVGLGMLLPFAPRLRRRWRSRH